MLRAIAIRNLFFANSHSKNRVQYRWILYFIPFERSISYLKRFYYFDFRLFWNLLRDPDCYIYQNNDKSRARTAVLRLLRNRSHMDFTIQCTRLMRCTSVPVWHSTQTFRDHQYLFEQKISSFASLFVRWCFSFYYYPPHNDMYCGALVIITNECWKLNVNSNTLVYGVRSVL